MDASNGVTGRLLDSYRKVGGLSNTDGVNLPSKREVGAICEDLLQVMFPGFHDVEPISKGSLPVLTRHRVARLEERIEEQVCRSFLVRDPECPKERACQVTHDFFAGDCAFVSVC